jgi:hypothetical protein
MSNTTTFTLLPEQRVKLTFSDDASGNLSLLGNPGDEPSGYTAITADDVVYLGTFVTSKDYRIILETGSYIKELVDDFTQTDDLADIATSGLYTDLTITPETNIIEIDNDATGTEIATAVNSILDLLIAKGLMAEPTP